MKYVLFPTGLVCLLLSIPVYFFTGALSTIEEVPAAHGQTAAAAFVSAAALCFYFAWRDHVTSRLSRMAITKQT